MAKDISPAQAHWSRTSPKRVTTVKNCADAAESGNAPGDVLKVPSPSGQSDPQIDIDVA
jgi:hypothetical protein